MKLSDFNIEKSFTSTNGECHIATSKLDGKKYFIKKSTDVTYGSPSDPPELKKMYKDQADDWMNYHNRIRKEFTKLGNGSGTIVFPLAYFVDEGKICEIAYFIEINKMAVSDEDKKTAADRKVADLEPAEKIRIMQTSSFALKQIHELGIIHCDLKPDNVPISKSAIGGYISKITDCGDAIFANDVPEESSIVCTEPYWSPELAAYKLGHEEVRSRITCKNDVFAMALIFHEWWTGDFPFYPGRDDFVSLYQVIDRVWPKNIKPDPSMPKWLADLIIDMLCPVPEKRPGMNVVFDAIKNQKYETIFKPVPNKLDYSKLKELMNNLPKGDDVQKYTSESYEILRNTVQAIENNIKKLTLQKQIDTVTAKLQEAMDGLKLKPQNGGFAKIEKAIAAIEAKDLSGYTPESRNNLLKFVNFAKSKRNELVDENNINRLYAALVNAYKSLAVRTDFSVEVVSPLPQPYTNVEIISDDFVIAHYGKGQIKLSVENAIRMRLVKRK